jgi:hypothetical protein
VRVEARLHGVRRGRQSVQGGVGVVARFTHFAGASSSCVAMDLSGRRWPLRPSWYATNWARSNALDLGTHFGMDGFRAPAGLPG